MRQTEEVQSFSEVQMVYDTLAHLEREYPGFADWYWQKVCPGLLDGSRGIFVVRMHGDLAGVVIGRRRDPVPKLCTLWVSPLFTGAGIGSALFDTICKWLGTTSPTFSVPEERVASFQWMVKRSGTQLLRVEDGRYGPGRKEFVFGKIAQRA